MNNEDLEQMLDDIFYKKFGRYPLKGKELELKLQLKERLSEIPELDVGGRFTKHYEFRGNRAR